jgi:hypothetical protein
VYREDKINIHTFQTLAIHIDGLVAAVVTILVYTQYLLDRSLGVPQSKSGQGGDKNSCSC